MIYFILFSFYKFSLGKKIDIGVVSFSQVDVLEETTLLRTIVPKTCLK
jgi:hypothetical protein